MEKIKEEFSGQMSARGGSAWGGKIILIHSIYKPHARGGAEVVVENIAQGLKNRGDDVVAICVGRKNAVDSPTPPSRSGVAPNASLGAFVDAHSVRFHPSLRDPLGQGGGLTIYRVKPFNLFNFLDINSKPAWFRLPWHILDLANDIQTWRIYRILKKEKPDVVFTHNLKGLGYNISWLLKIMKIKQVHTVHDMQLIHPSGLLLDDQKLGIAVKIYGWFCRLLFSPVESVVYPSEYIKNIYDRYGFFKQAEKIIIGNPIVAIPPLPEGGSRGGGSSNQLSANPSFISPWKGEKSDGKFQLLFLGQVEKYKGILNLIKALKQVKRDLVLNVVGDGQALSEAKSMAQKGITEGHFGAQNRPTIVFWGRLGQSELAQKIWPQTDLLVNPTLVPESFGMVVLEAMAHGVPSISSNIGALPELVQDGQTGWLVKPGGINELAKKIETISANFCAYNAIGVLCQEEAKKFAIEKYLNKLTEFAKMKKI